MFLSAFLPKRRRLLSVEAVLLLPSALPDVLHVPNESSREKPGGLLRALGPRERFAHPSQKRPYVRQRLRLRVHTPPFVELHRLHVLSSHRFVGSSEAHRRK